MQFQTLESVSDGQREPRRNPLPPYLLAFVGGFLAVVVTFAVSGGVHRHLIVWPISGIIIALSLPCSPVWRNNKLPIYLAGGAGVLAGGLLSGMPWRLAVLITSLTCVDLTIEGFFLSPHIQSFNDLKKRRNGMRLVLASVLAPLLTGILGAIPVAAFLQASSPIMMAGMSALADALGIAISVPLILFVTTGVSYFRHELLETPLPWVLSFTFFAVVCGGTFWQNTGPYLFLIFPPMMVLLLTAGLEGALFSSILITVIGSFATLHGHGPICLVRTSSPEVRLITLQVFIWVSLVTSLPVGAALDERRKAERTATNSRSVQQTILKHTREAIILSSLDGRERFASAAIEQLTGWTPSEYICLDRMEMVHPDDRDRAHQMITSLSCGTRDTTLRYRLLHKNGDWSWVEASVSTYGEDEIAGYVGTVRDISRLIETEQGWIEERRAFSEEQQRLAEAESAAKFQITMRDEFLSHVSHELRSPLTSIYSFSSIIADGLAGATTSEQDEYLGIVMKNAVQLQSMIEDLLTVTQSREGKLKVSPQATSLTEGIADACNTIRGFADRKKITLAVDPFAKADYLYADPTRLRQILIILLDNAIKFTPEGGNVRVNVSSHMPDCLVVKVIDSGCGIPQDKWGAVFDKLYQIEGPNKHDTSTAGRTGLGLGLHIARSLVARHSGQIWVTSRLGEGSIFQFTMPIYKQQDNLIPVAVDSTRPLLVTGSVYS